MKYHNVDTTGVARDEDAIGYAETFGDDEEE